MKKEKIEQLKNIKIAFFDVDETLFINRFLHNNKMVLGMSDSDWGKYCKGNLNAYENCKAPKNMKDVLIALQNNGCQIYALTQENLVDAFFAKRRALYKQYPEIFNADNKNDILGVSDKKEKPVLMKKIMTKHNLIPDNILFVDDDYDTVIQSELCGFTTYHTVEFLNNFCM